MKISVIIPAFNEAGHIENLVAYLHLHGAASLAQVIVADGGSTDNTVLLAEKAGALAVRCPEKGRSRQMNFGAARATGQILYFVHADTLPPPSYAHDLLQAVQEGYGLGRYCSRFLSSSPILRINEFFTRFDLFICMGGDQTLFIRKELFDTLGGFNPELLIMEEYEFCSRARKGERYKIMKSAALISARKYEKNGWLRVQKANYKVVKLYRQGAAQEELLQTYRKMLRW
ncbi:MAG TPA: TIGR04283 family arsenosugar biosynthesis glycosyltransferase [Flavisolibacter sp.]|nr:TIGR04283 family arsenosugar biosynthesis glycosyltransferase [Flavisolibacter sp.]